MVKRCLLALFSDEPCSPLRERTDRERFLQISSQLLLFYKAVVHPYGAPTFYLMFRVEYVKLGSRIYDKGIQFFPSRVRSEE